MKRTFLFFILLLASTWSSSGGLIGQQSLTFDDLGLGGGTAASGTYNSNDTFSFDVNLTFNGYNAVGLSFWLEASTAFAGSLSITGVTYGTTFPDPQSSHPNPIPFNSSAGASPSSMTETFDLGSSMNAGSIPPGTYFVAHITFTIAGAMPGTYDLASTTVSPKSSEVTCFDGGLPCFLGTNLPAAHYSITIVPEPATVGLLGMGAVGLAAVLLRRKR